MPTKKQLMRLHNMAFRTAGCGPYLDLQNIVPTDPLVMHLIICIISISAIFILHKGEATHIHTSQHRKLLSYLEKIR